MTTSSWQDGFLVEPAGDITRLLLHKSNTFKRAAEFIRDALGRHWPTVDYSRSPTGSNLLNDLLCAQR
jgi:hypothetical protein